MPRAGEVKLEELVGLVRNPKDHDIGEIIKSIRRFGFIHRTIINSITGHMVAGHGRVEGLRQMKAGGEKAPLGIRVEGGSWYVPTDYEEIEPSEEEAVAIALNRLEEIGGWVDGTLSVVLGDLAAQGEKMLEGIGFNGDDLDEILARLDAGKAGDKAGRGEEINEGEVHREIAMEKWGVRYGDVWQIGPHVVICGDCKDGRVWEAGLELLDIGKVDGIITSPPYANQRAEDYESIDEDVYVEWWEGVQRNCMEHLAKDGSFFVDIKAHSKDGERALYVMDLVLAMRRKWGWKFIEEYCWERTSAPGIWPNRFKNGFEPIFHFGLDTNVKFFPYNVAGEEAGVFLASFHNDHTGNYYNTATSSFAWDGALPSNRISIAGNATGANHPAAFPYQMPMFFMQAFSEVGDVWCDPFMGGGSAILAAQQCGRVGMGIEVSPAYVAVTLERLEQANLGLEIEKVGDFVEGLNNKVTTVRAKL